MQRYVWNQQRHHNAREVVGGFAADLEPDELHVLAADAGFNQRDVGLDMQWGGGITDYDEGARGVPCRDAHHRVRSVRSKRGVVARCDDVDDRKANLCLFIARGSQGVSV